MVTIVVENVVISTSEFFGELLEYINKVMLGHFGFSEIDFPIKVIISSFGINDDNAALISVNGDDTITVFFATEDRRIKYLI